jgi:calcium-dependent protein kinase
MLLAVAYLHANSVAHRDLKLENFLYESKETDHLKLIDFGFAKFWDRGKKMEQACGSVHYVAPEVLAHAYTLKADSWSLGVIVYMLLTGSPPFHGSDDEVLRKVKAGKPHWSSRFHKLSDTAKEFVQKLLVLDPNERMSSEQALNHAFLVDRSKGAEVVIEPEVLGSLRKFAHAAHFKRAIYSMMAWSLDMDQRAELRDLFLAVDKEHRGRVTHVQVKDILMEKFHISNDEAEVLFNSMDTDHDDEIAYSEFLAAVMQDRIRLHEDVLRKTFMRFDVDDSGYISAGDLHTLLGSTFEGKDVEELISEADVNHDGYVSYDEFLQYFQKAEEDPDEDPSSPQSVRSATDRAKRDKHTERLCSFMDTLVSSHFDEASPTAHGGKTPLMRSKDRAKTWTSAKTPSGFAVDSPSSEAAGTARAAKTP